MGHEAIATFMRPGYPKESKDDSAYRTIIEYVGLKSDLQSSNSGIDTGIPWGDFQGLVKSAELDPIEGTNPARAILTVQVERKFETADYPQGNTGEIESTNYEVDWVDVSRSMYEHPEFETTGNGAHKLTEEDIAAIKQWEGMPDPNYKKDFIYATVDYSKWAGGSSDTKTLSDNAKKFAKGILLGIDHWIDKAPVARRNEEYNGGPPPKGSAGKKESPIGFPNLPTGYEWIRNADRSIKQGGHKKWQRSLEWLGAKKVLVDVDKIYW